ncbi:DUF998 domain-containing protein [Nocardia farcinica]|uniref:DUF998 domain-containing protein n=1 Tax=Nocardia farcinica TaxID=37329 RepID=UPI0018957666|nr:DUF998 domain-containing protein [Nocardia farcinica]MBF6071879.1 DUF998 domain-containing protein [Nocardia farcinica]MBF6264064.1 DUF998 domain-containing protein [Nocardia farcinica]MBF6283066.1 DUF998 domain-containing protein [Nocardia farcinica]MBF6306930.1 DUF998 domain-containing protein [Nocardia farcinica]MBF6391355.1 DUF998 domain-containing protein [Nocardia farcinica]
MTSRRLAAVLAVVIAVAGLSYSAWVLQFVLPVHADPVHSFLSELDAEGKPYRTVFAAGDVLTGALLIPAGLAGLLLFPRRPLTTLGWAALTVFGAATIADALIPLRDCAPGEPGCGGPRELFPQLHQPHALTSTLAVTAIAVAVAAFSLAAFRYRRWRVLREFGIAAFLAGAVATVWMLVADRLPGEYALGIAQRIQVGAMSVWLLTLAVAVLVEARE